jgi:hypothetical protein
MIFGIVALVMNKDGRQYRRGRAVAGAVVGVVAFVAACSTGTGLVTGTVESGQFLTVGNCLDETPQAPTGRESPFNGAIAGEQNSVGCDQPHSDEVFAVLSLSRFPNVPTDSGELVNGCRAQLQKYSPSASRDPSVRIVLVTPGTNWKYMSDQTAACLAHFTPNRVGPIKS